MKIQELALPRYISSKKNLISSLVVVVTAGLIFSFPNFNPLVLLGHDANFHIARYAGTWRAISDGHLIPQLDSAFYGGFGYAPNLFYPPLSAYLVVLLQTVVTNWNLAINFTNIIIQVGAGLAMFAFMRRVTCSNFAGLLSALAYMSAPYVIANGLIRFAAGEYLGLVFAPIVFLGLWKIIHGESGWLLLGLATGGLLLSHNLSTGIFGLFALLFLLAYAKTAFQVAALKQYLFAAALAFGLSAFFLLPLLEARASADYNAFHLGFLSDIERVQAAAVPSMLMALLPNFNPPFSWIGFLATLALLIAPLVAGFWPHKWQKMGIVSTGLAILSLFISSRFFPWKLMPEQLLLIQFPWRLNLIVTFFLSCLIGLVFAAPIRMKRVSKVLYRLQSKAICIKAVIVAVVAALATISIAMSLPYLPPRDDANVWDAHMLGVQAVWNWDYVPTRTVVADGFFARDHNPTALTGEMSFDNFAHFGRHLSLTAKVETRGILELPLMFYPGYRAEVDGNRVPVFESNYGFVAVDLPAGTHQVAVEFAMSPATKVGASLTGVTLLAIAAYGATRHSHAITVFCQFSRIQATMTRQRPRPVP